MESKQTGKEDDDEKKINFGKSFLTGNGGTWGTGAKRSLRNVICPTQVITHTQT